ncbi:MAG: 3-keto-disaccharide hydrolase [Opitutaceae bacterium]
MLFIKVIPASILILASILTAAALHAEAGFRDLLASGDLSAFHTGDKAGRWTYVEGVATRGPEKTGSLVTRDKFKDFELRFDWKIAEGGNSGVIYRNKPWPGLEYQVLDDVGHIRGKEPLTSAGALYDLVAPIADKPLNPAGEWNTARIIAKGTQVEHWLNGVKILDVEMLGKDWKARFEKSKYSKKNASFDAYGTNGSPIHFQDHGAEVWYRNILIREL